MKTTDNGQRTTDNGQRTFLVFFLVIIAFYLYGLNLIPFVGPDEPRYAQVGREMFERGDWITPTLGGYTWFEKPVLLYWLEIVSYRLFGVSEFSARLGSALSGLITAFTLYRFGNKIQDSKTTTDNGLWASVVFATSLGAIVFSRAVAFDNIVTMPITVSLAFFFVSDIEETGRKRLWYLAGFYAFMGVALLAKGLIGVVIPCGVVFWYFAIQRRLPDRKFFLSLLWGMLLCLLVAAVWYVPVIMKNGWKFVDEFFIQHHFARYTSNKYLHPQPFYFFFLIAPLFVLPWTPFLVTALWNFKNFQWRKIESVDERFRLFVLIWLVLPILFFSLSGSKLPGYILPVLPAMALFAGQQIAHYTNNQENTKAMCATGILLALFSLAGAIFVLRKTDVSKLCVMLVFIPPCVAGMFAVAGEQKRKLYALLIALAVLCSSVVALNCLVYTFVRHDSVAELIVASYARGYVKNPVLCLHTINHSAEFYAAGRLWRDKDGKQKRFEDVREVAEVSRRGRQKVLVLVPLEHLHQLTESKIMYAETIADNGELAIVTIAAK
jgi:4-amino-4-deoxy-L-arabinose transferase-like glycosyltransferase